MPLLELNQSCQTPMFHIPVVETVSLFWEQIVTLSYDLTTPPSQSSSKEYDMLLILPTQVTHRLVRQSSVLPPKNPIPSKEATCQPHVTTPQRATVWSCSMIFLFWWKPWRSGSRNGPKDLLIPKLIYKNTAGHRISNPPKNLYPQPRNQLPLLAMDR